MLIKVVALGICGYLKDNFNIFDGSLVLLSLVDLILSTFFSFSGGLSALSAFRSLRLFRILKLARSWENLRELLIAMVKTF
jgi:hypothetical protein